MTSYISDKATFLGSDTTTGQLFVIDHYPGMVYHPDSSHLVFGDLYGFNPKSSIGLKILPGVPDAKGQALIKAS